MKDDQCYELFGGIALKNHAFSCSFSRKTRTILAQLRTDHSRIHGQYMKKIDPTARNHCHNCGYSPCDTHNLYDCPSKPTTLAVESLWTVPTETAKHLNLAIDETS